MNHPLTMTSNDKYALNWDNHTKYMKRAFDMLRKTNDFVDVTLCCEGKKIKAHKVILSACSPYFHDLLTDNPCAHPIIILRDVTHKDMVGILEFMYLGEVQVPTENFNSFLRVAELLKVSGLAEDIEKNEKTNNNMTETSRPETPKPDLLKTGTKRSRPAEKEKKKISEIEKEEKVQIKKKRESSSSPLPSEHGNEVTEEAEPVKTSEAVKSNVAMDLNKIDHPQNIASIQKLLSSADFLMKVANPENECPICAQKFTTMFLLKQHIPYHLGETKCQHCATVFSRKDLLKKHLLAVHKVPFSSSKKE